MASISCLVNVFSEILELKRSLVEGQQLQQKDRKKRKEESEKKKMVKNKKPKVVGWLIVQKLFPNFDFCTCLGKEVVLNMKCKDACYGSKAVLIDLKPFQLILDLKMSKTS